MAKDRQDFQWRPNDNSSSTNLKYDLEAEHWTRAFKSAQMKQQSSSLGGCLSVVGMVIQLVVSLFALVVLGIVDFINWLRS